MNTILWAAQILLAAVFFYSGVNKGIYSEKQLIARGQTGVVNLPLPFIRFIGISGMLGAVGIIVPQALGVLPVLTTVAAAGLGIIMVPAAFIHYKLHEPKNVLTNVVLFAMAAFVVLGRA
ncbi:MAG TPA: DoxX family protein [Chitinophagaceae bacterium]|nr:DoxX family protein [Chitinophagaceae bacterium]